MAGEGTARFPSTMRLKRKTEFLRVFREGSVWKGRCFSLHGRARTTEEPQAAAKTPRLGIVVTKKIGTAVERNRIKRRIREVFRKRAHSLPPMDVIVVPKRTCLDASEGELRNDLGRAMTKVIQRTKERT
jgi:ribonuclease P protein component